MKPVLALSLSLFLSAVAHGHGVERGTRASVLGQEIQARIMTEVNERCDLNRALSVDVKDVSVASEVVDQREKDLFYTVTLAANVVSVNDEFVREQTITVQAAQYAVSNPSVDKYDILSVRSPICE